MLCFVCELSKDEASPQTKRMVASEYISLPGSLQYHPTAPIVTISSADGRLAQKISSFYAATRHLVR